MLGGDPQFQVPGSASWIAVDSPFSKPHPPSSEAYFSYWVSPRTPGSMDVRTSLFRGADAVCAG